MPQGDTGDQRFRHMKRRNFLITGAGALANFAMVRVRPSRVVEECSILEFRKIFDHMRSLGLLISPALVLPIVVNHISALCEGAAGAARQRRHELLVLASRFAEYAGWMSQEAGDHRLTRRWTEKAVSLAAAAGDRGMARYALVRYAEMVVYERDATATIELARRAQTDGAVPQHILGLAKWRNRSCIWPDPYGIRGRCTGGLGHSVN